MKAVPLAADVVENSTPKKLRVAVFNRIFSPTGGGAERYSIALVEHLAGQHDIHVFAQHIAHQYPGVTYHLIPTPLRKPRWVNQIWFAWATWRATRQGFDVVHSHENTWHGNVQTVHVLPVKHNLFKGRSGLARWLRWGKVLSSPRLAAYLLLEHFRFAARPHRHIVVTSQSLLDVMRATYPACSAMLSVITPGFDLPADEPDGEPLAVQQAARGRLGLPRSSRCLLLVANDWRKKGLATVLEAMSQLPADTVLAVVGNTDQLPDFQATLARWGLTSRVFFLGRLHDVSDAYRAADCLVHPTLEDTFAMVVLEAMAFGLPVVVSGVDYCGIAGLLNHQVNAWLLDNPRDAGELASALQTLLTDPAQRAAMGASAALFARGYQWKDMAALQQAVYQNIACKP